MKRCCKCKIEKEITLFVPSKVYKSGYANSCLDCVKKYQKKYRELNKEKSKKYNAAYKKANADYYKEYGRSYYNQNKERILAEFKVIYDLTKNERNKKRRSRYDPVKQKEITLKQKKYAIDYVAKNKEAIRTYLNEYRRKNKVKVRLADTIGRHKRRANLKHGGKIDREAVEKLYHKQKKCYWCECILKDENKTIDHYIPISKGGTNDINNLVIACKTCNSAKRDKSPYEYAIRMGKLF